jgi:FKBP-type peptidyl-prolyl cis-trans isomerase
MTRQLSVRLLIAVLAVSVVAGACGGGDESAGGSPTGTATSGDDGPDEPTATAEPTAAPTPTETAEVDLTDLSSRPFVKVPDADPPDELVTEDLIDGDGPRAAAGDALLMRYVGASYSTGLEFDASWDRDQAFGFELGSGSVIAGWDEGIEGMAAGGRRVLTIPSDLAYGEAGRPPTIAPSETLIFIVDLVSVVPADAEKPEVPIPDEPAEKFSFEDLIVGDGPKPEQGDIVYMHFVGASQSTGEEFDASWDRGPAAYVVGQFGVGQFIDGIEAGLVDMKAGGRRVLFVPPSLGFDDSAAGDGSIAADETLVIVVDLLWVDKVTSG